ncbi:MAG: 30S ribosomal protein S6 [Oscillospiraceae bacterium]|nr:30S ribosomal protein S6 [Oscillospiraceae bacterium]
MVSLGEYETMFVVDSSLGDEVVAQVVEKFKGLISSHGEIKAVSEWGKKRLAYAINHKMEGFYCVVAFLAPPEFPAELDRVFRITDSIMRSLTIRRDK